METAPELQARLSRLGSKIREFRSKCPRVIRFPDELKREAVELLSAGISGPEVSAVCGLSRSITYSWRKQCSERSSTAPTSHRTLRVVPNRSGEVLPKSAEQKGICEIDFGCAVVMRVPMNELTTELLRRLKEAFKPC